METLQYAIIDFDPIKASDDLCLRYFDFGDKTRFEYDPDEPAPDLDVRFKYLRDSHPYYDNKRWLVTTEDNGEELIIASMLVGWTKPEHPGYEKNKSTGAFDITVLKEYRNRGIGTKLFPIGMEEILKHEEVQFIIPGSDKEYVWQLMEKYGGKFSSDGAENRMYMRDVDWDMINEWIAAGRDLADKEGVTLQLFEECPDDILEEYANLYHETMNQQPLGEWDGEITVTPESYRLQEAREKEKGMERYTLISREADGTISGLTELYRHKAVAHKGMQNLTGVKDEYRGRGLGKWLKAELLLRMKEKFPEWVYISTGNDETNAPMLSINNRMGFKQFNYAKSYKFDVHELNKRFIDLHS